MTAGAHPCLATPEFLALCRRAGFQTGEMHDVNGDLAWHVVQPYGVNGVIEAKRLAEMVAADEREVCALRLEAAADRLEPAGSRTNQVDRHTADVLRRQAAAIRNPDGESR